jgi:hypothetical protein
MEIAHDYSSQLAFWGTLAQSADVLGFGGEVFPMKIRMGKLQLYAFSIDNITYLHPFHIKSDEVSLFLKVTDIETLITMSRG